MSVTIKDVAALAGVSTSTVSRVCNNNPATANAAPANEAVTAIGRRDCSII